MSSQQPRRFIAVNAVVNDVEAMVVSRISATVAPFSTRLRQGFVRPAPGPEPRDVELRPGTVGKRLAHGVRFAPGKRGQAATCHCGDVAPGNWSVLIEIAWEFWPAKLPGPLKLEVVRGGFRLAQRYLVNFLFGAQLLRIDFAVPAESNGWAGSP